jgi:GT2 family glycosyltransferase
MTIPPKVSVIIVNWNGLKDTIECIESLNKINYSNFEIIVVDNGSKSDDARILRNKFKEIRLLELKRNLGFAIGNNIGIMVALQNKSDYVLLLNNDTVVDKYFLDEMIMVAESKQHAGVLGSKIYLYDKKRVLWYAGGKINLYVNHVTQGQNQSDNGQYDVIKDTCWISGACMLIRRDVFDRIGFLSREYFLGWEDIDFCLSARRKGYGCVYVPTSVIWHKASASYRRYNLNYMQVLFGFRNRIIIRYKFMSKPNFLLFILIQLGIIIPVHIAYYVLVYKDLRRVIFMVKGIFTGLKDMRKRKIVYAI